MRPGQRRQPGLQYGIYLLGLQAINFGIDKIPPVTLFGIAAQVNYILSACQVILEKRIQDSK